MSNVELSALISRLDFAWITSFHIIYPPLTIGLAVMLFFAIRGANRHSVDAKLGREF